MKEFSITVQDGHKQVEIKKEDISYIVKSVRFTFTRNYLLIIVTKKGNFLSRRRYLTFNDPKIDLMFVFKNMGIELINLP